MWTGPRVKESNSLPVTGPLAAAAVKKIVVDVERWKERDAGKLCLLLLGPGH